MIISINFHNHYKYYNLHIKPYIKFHHLLNFLGQIFILLLYFSQVLEDLSISSKFASKLSNIYQIHQNYQIFNLTRFAQFFKLNRISSKFKNFQHHSFKKSIYCKTICILSDNVLNIYRTEIWHHKKSVEDWVTIIFGFAKYR